MTNLKNEFLKIISSRVKVYLIIIILLLFFICKLNPEYIIASIVCLLAISIYSYWAYLKKKAVIEKQMGYLTLNLDSITKQALKEIEIPVVVFEDNGKILYENLKFTEMFVNQNKLQILKEYIKGINSNQITGYINKDFTLDNKTYNVLGSFSQKSSNSLNYMYMLYFIDKTELVSLKTEYNNKKHTVGIIMVDNYEDFMQNVETESRPQVIASIEKNLYDWATPTGGVIIKVEKDKFVYIFDRENVNKFAEDKFSILDNIRNIASESRIPLTLSIGICMEGESYYELYKGANAALDIALGRGGDQVVIKKEGKFNFFGGKVQEVEKRTKVKVRVVAQALEELINEAENVVIMGHTNSDIDCIGSALGICSLTRKKNKETYIVLNAVSPTLGNFMKSIEKEEIYNGVFVNENEAASKVTADTLLIVVDTNRKSYVDAPGLLEKTSNIVIIDHHRMGEDFIEQSILTLHEVYASSSAELVTEILSYSRDNLLLSQLEAESLYSGIMIDTKNFTFKTGVRTFEAAAFLKRSGIDIIKIKQWFETDLETHNTISDIVKSAEIFHEKIAIAMYTTYREDAQLIAAKSADEILTISGITASFVIYKLEGRIGISGRSIGDINVQLLLEKLGGGGHATVAGAQISNSSTKKVKAKLIELIDEYFAENNE